MTMKIIAKKGKSLFLVQSEKDPAKSRVWSDKEKEWHGEEFNTQSILMRGYWDAVDGEFDPETKKVALA